ncbi:hypothetical protein ACIQNG_26260 [Streptomyces sp. NPDC091377]|uniref:hypothetical protein n=1 Tax=Streptomyces sp. NPDC091377 TaxID=3365995 RepID=UPI003814CDBC
MLTAALTGTVAIASADGAAPVSDDAHIFNPNEEGLFELQAPDEGNGGAWARNFTSELKGWGSGSHESRHWADNDYTEIQFTTCEMIGAAGKSVGVKLWQAIPFNQDKDMGVKTFTNCFTGPGKTSKGEWNAHYSSGDNRYFTIDHLNGSQTARLVINVKKVYVDTSKAD